MLVPHQNLSTVMGIEATSSSDNDGSLDHFLKVVVTGDSLGVIVGSLRMVVDHSQQPDCNGQKKQLTCNRLASVVVGKGKCFFGVCCDRWITIWRCLPMMIIEEGCCCETAVVVRAIIG